jgi:hypothetical protein
VGEFLNRVESREQYPWMVWELNEGWTTFINIGIWREGADFQQQIGRFIDNSRPPLAFEADRRAASSSHQSAGGSATRPC